MEKNPYKWIVNTLLFFCIPQVWTPITFVIIAAILIHISWSKCTAYTAMAGSYDNFIWTGLSSPGLSSSSFCMCLMDSYINIDNEFVSKNPEILVTRWIQEMCQNSCFVKLCSFRIIIHVCNDSYKTFLNVRFFITGGLLCIMKSRIWNSLLRATGASECIGCTEPYTDR